MRTTITTRRAGLAGILTLAALVIAACGGSAVGPTGTVDGTTPSPTAGPRRWPGSDPTDASVIPSFDLGALTSGIPGVDSYRTSFGTAGVVTYTSVVVTEPVLSKAITTFNDDGSVDSRIVIIGEEAWTADGEDGAFEVIPAALAPSMLLAFDPTLMLAAYAGADLGAIGANQGTEDKNGVRAAHVRSIPRRPSGSPPPSRPVPRSTSGSPRPASSWRGRCPRSRRGRRPGDQVTDVNDPANVAGGAPQLIDDQ